MTHVTMTTTQTQAIIAGWRLIEGNRFMLYNRTTKRYESRVID